MKIYFAGLSGISNISRLMLWVKVGISYKLISFFEIQKGDGIKEYEKLKEIKSNH